MTAGKLEEMKQEIFFLPKVYVFPFELNYFLIRIILLKMNNKKTNVPGPWCISTYGWHILVEETLGILSFHPHSNSREYSNLFFTDEKTWDRKVKYMLQDTQLASGSPEMWTHVIWHGRELELY